MQRIRRAPRLSVAASPTPHHRLPIIGNDEYEDDHTAGGDGSRDCSLLYRNEREPDGIGIYRSFKRSPRSMWRARAARPMGRQSRRAIRALRGHGKVGVGAPAVVAAPAAGDRGDGGLRAPTWAAVMARVRKWVRIWSITDRGVKNATTRIVPWPVGPARGATSPLCGRSAAHQRDAAVGANHGAGTIAGGAPARPARPDAAARAGGWRTSRRTAWSRGPCPECGPAPAPRTPGGPRFRCPRWDPPTYRSGRSPPSRSGRTSTAQAPPDSARSPARAGSRRPDHPRKPTPPYAPELPNVAM